MENDNFTNKKKNSNTWFSQGFSPHTKNFYFNSNSGSLGLGHTYGEHSFNGSPCHASRVDDFWGSQNFNPTDPSTKKYGW